MNFIKKFKKTFHITLWEAIIALLAIVAFFILEKIVFHGEHHLWLIIMGFIVGIWLAFRPSEWAVEGLNSGAKYVGLSEYVAGILSSLASNLPEAVIAILLIIDGDTLTAVVTVLSAAGFNTMILGIAILITTIKNKGHVDVPEDLEKKEAPIIRWAIVALLMTVVFGFSEYFHILNLGTGTLTDAVLTKPVGGMLAASYIFYLIYIIVVKDNNKKMSIKDMEEIHEVREEETKEIDEEIKGGAVTTHDHDNHGKLSVPMTIMFLVLGFVGIYFGGETLTWSVQQLIPISPDRTISDIITTALILGAAGAVPEHGIAVISAAKDDIEVGIGNAMGGILQSALLIFGIIGVITVVPLQPFILLQISAIAGALWFVKRCIQDGKFDTFEGIMILLLQTLVFIILFEDIAFFPQG